LSVTYYDFILSLAFENIFSLFYLLAIVFNTGSFLKCILMS